MPHATNEFPIVAAVKRWNKLPCWIRKCPFLWSHVIKIKCWKTPRARETQSVSKIQSQHFTGKSETFALFFALFSPKPRLKTTNSNKKNKAGAYRAQGDKFMLPPLSPVIQCQPFFFFPQLQLARLRAPSARLQRRIIHIRGGTMEEAIYMCGSIDLWPDFQVGEGGEDPLTPPRPKKNTRAYWMEERKDEMLWLTSFTYCFCHLARSKDLLSIWLVKHPIWGSRHHRSTQHPKKWEHT